MEAKNINNNREHAFRAIELFFEKNYDNIQPDGSLHIRRGIVENVGKYQIRINSGDHEPPHVHISLNNKQIASYYIDSGLPYRIKTKDMKMDALVKIWLNNESNRRIARIEWLRMQRK